VPRRQRAVVSEKRLFQADYGTARRFVIGRAGKIEPFALVAVHDAIIFAGDFEIDGVHAAGFDPDALARFSDEFFGGSAVAGRKTGDAGDLIVIDGANA
jgi:hypothetical protein